MQFSITFITLFLAATASAIPSGADAAMVEAREIGNSVAERSIGSTICKGACQVACNSTVLALAQAKCLEICLAKC